MQIEKQNEEISEAIITDNLRAEIHKEAEALLADSLAFGLRLHLNRMAWLHNVHAHQSYRSAGFKSFRAYLDGKGISKTYAEKYIRLARGLASRLNPNPDAPYRFFQKDLDEMMKAAGKEYRRLSVNDLFERSALLDSASFLDEGSESPILALLPPPKEESETAGAEVKPKTELQEFNEHMRKVLEPFGYVWNAKEKRCEHSDGTALTDDELALITSPDSALRMWRHIERDAQAAVKKIEQTAILHMDTFMRYKKALPNRKLEEEVGRVRNDLRNQFNAIIHMLDAVIDCDKERVKEIKKYGLEEA